MPTFFTLGPSGTCHENALRHYLDFQGVDASIELVEDFFVGLEWLRASRSPTTFLLQCSAHPLVHEITERHWREVFVVDTFIYPTKALALLRARDGEPYSSLGIVPANTGYVNIGDWPVVRYEPSKPIVGQKLRAGCYSEGVTHAHYAEDYPDELTVVTYIGAVDTTWLVYGTRKRFQGEVIGLRCPELLVRPTDS
jgi:hypothetical protein